MGTKKIDIFNQKERIHWCEKLSCNVKELIIAEYYVGQKIPLIKHYLENKV